MVFPKNDYLTFSVSATTPVNFSFPLKKPKRFFIDFATNDSAIRFMINEDSVGALLHGSRNNNLDIRFTDTINNLKITTTSDTAFYITLIVEEWSNQKGVTWNRQF